MRKRVKTYDATVEIERETEEQGDIELEWVTLQVSDDLIAELDKRYPPSNGGQS